MDPATTRKTPEPSSIVDLDYELDTSSPVKPLKLPVSGHNAEELAQRNMRKDMREMSVQHMWELLDKSKEDMEKTFDSLPSMADVVKAVKQKSGSEYEPYPDFLNKISDIVREALAYTPETVIRFFDSHTKPPKCHPTATKDKPDFVALKVKPNEGNPPDFYWPALEATGELLSGTNKERSSTKTAAYTSYLLQSRPDMLMVQGIYVDEGGFKLTVSNACGASYTEYLDWGSLENCLLLCAWIWRLYEPFVDPSITANPEPDKPQIFTIEIHEDLYRCNIRRVGTTIGRRTIIFDGKAPNNAKPDIIIKEQYIETSRRFNEGAILEKAHREKKTFPGVVRAGWSGPVKSGEKDLIVQWKDPKTGEIYERKKTRVVLLDKGGPIMDAKTPREVLVAMYDLLESEPLHQRQDALLIMQQVTRFLHKKRKILHRDISASNVLLRDAATTDESLADDLQEMCFASHLLRDRFGDPKSALSSKVVASTHFHSANRLDTKVLLIDFDMGEDQDYNGQGGDKKGPHERTVRRYLIMRWSWLMRHRQGTPIFMARDVVSAEENQGVYFLFSMPQLDQGLKTYQAAVGDRLIDFPPNELEICKIDVNQPLKPFKHKLRYDAESVFWLLLWWAIHALPVEEAPFYNRKEIPQDIWVTLTSGNNEIDPRTRFVPRFPRKIVHPIYEPLEELLKDMAAQLDGYPEKSEVPSRRKDEYIHEAFQRLILEFLCKRCDERFMTAEKSDKFRQPEESAGMKGLLSTKYKEEKSGASSSSRPVDTPPSREPRQKRKISYTVASGSPEIGEDAKDEDFRPGKKPRN